MTHDVFNIADVDIFDKTEELIATNRPVVTANAHAISGTVKSICVSCSSGMVFRREADTLTGTQTVICHQIRREMPPDIVECTNYYSRTTMSVHDMMRIALPVDPRLGINRKAYI